MFFFTNFKIASGNGCYFFFCIYQVANIVYSSIGNIYKTMCLKAMDRKLEKK
jgi:hypothetical protein